MDYEESDSDESWTTESAISSEAILSSMCMNGGEEKPFACPVPGCKKRYKVKEISLAWHNLMENGQSCVSRVWGEVLPSAETIGCVATVRSGPALVSGWVFPSADLCGNYRSDFVVVVGGSCL